MLRSLAIVALVVIGLLAIQGRTILELTAIALIVLIFGGAALVVVKLASMLTRG